MYRHRVSMCEEIAFPLSPNQAVADFRYRFKNAKMRVAAVGLANIACRAGLPFGNRALYAVHQACCSYMYMGFYCLLIICALY